jgi:addiction module HigA family antidote
MRKKIYRNESTEEGRRFWAGVEKVAEECRKWPDWKRAGINVSATRVDKVTEVPTNREPTTVGEMIDQEFLAPRMMSQAALALRMDVSVRYVSQLISGKLALTTSAAILLEEALGVKAATWLNIQAAHDLWKGRVQAERAPEKDRR